jgi:hypothetical protein
MKQKFFIIALASAALSLNVRAWDYEGHRAVNELALASLPTNFPAFVLEPAARERVAFLAGEADRWRNITDAKQSRGLELGHCSGPDHYLDLEQIAEYELTPATLPPFRFDFIAAIARARAQHPERFAPIDPAKNSDHTRELCGLLPWAINENFQKLQSGFSTLDALQKYGGTPEEIANAKQSILYVMGVMGHFVGDASQPLHATKHHHGWVTNATEGNPNHYTTSFGFHGWIDGGFFKKTGGIDVKKISEQIKPAKPISNALDADGIFAEAVDFVVQANKLVEPLYILDRDGKLSNKPGRGVEGRAFLEGQLVKSGEFLGSIWLTAYLTAPEDTFLIKILQERTAAPGASAPTAPGGLRVETK